jgi:hypothetical protein
MRIDQISTQVRSIHLNRHQNTTHDNLTTARTEIRHVSLQQPVSDRASDDEIIQASLPIYQYTIRQIYKKKKIGGNAHMVQSNLDLGNQFLLAVLARLVQSVGLDHGIQLRASGQDGWDRSHDSEEVGGVAEDGEGAEVVIIAGEEGVAG